MLYTDKTTVLQNSPHTPFVRLLTPTETSLYFPYSDDISFSASQEYSQPVKEFFSWLKDSVSGTESISGTVVSAASGLSDILGVKMYNKYYFASAWTGSKPSTFTLSLKFNIGLLGLWDGKTEVYEPIMLLMKETVPGGDVVLTAPSTNALGAFQAFGQEYLKAIREVNQLGQSVYKTWSLAFGVDLTSGTKEYLTFNNYVAETASYKLSNKLDENGYPISGEISLNFKSQTISVRNDFNIR